VRGQRVSQALVLASMGYQLERPLRCEPAGLERIRITGFPRERLRGGAEDQGLACCTI